MASKVPVVISDVCGAAEHVIPDAGAVLSLSESMDTWVDALEHQLSRTNAVPQFKYSWREVAQEYEIIYWNL